MFSLKKFFFWSGGSAVLIFIMLFTAGIYQHDSQNVETFGERENIQLASFLRNFIFQKTNLEEALRLDGNQKFNLQELKQIIDDFSVIHPILKVKIFALDGDTRFSTVASEIGQDKDSKGFQVAAGQGKAVSEMTFKASFVSLAGVLKNRQIVETYLPIDNSQGKRIGVFELYSDVTPLLEKSQSALYEFLLLLIAGYLLLFVFLYMLVRRADNIIKQQYHELNITNQKLGEIRQSLEMTVAERTEALSQTVSTLQKEIRVRHEAELEQRKLSVAVEQSPSSVLFMDTAGLVQYSNPRFFEVSGRNAESVIGEHCKTFIAGSMEQEQFNSIWRNVLKGRAWHGEVINNKQGGEPYSELLNISPVFDKSGKIDFILSTSEDITSRKKSEDEIYHLAHHDTLTGLFNRFALEQRLEQAVVQSERSGLKLAVLFLDLDRFKIINDTLGHKAGDELLKQVSERLSGICRRRSDIVARLGGDEFVVVLTEIDDPSFAALTAQTLVQVLSLPYSFEHHEMLTSPSIGISVYPEDGKANDNLLKNADTAMYHVKQSGRSSYSFFKQEMNEMVSEKFLLEKELRHALAENGLELHYQPQVCLKDGRVCGVEALLRWPHPELGYISPEKFIPIAEETGMIYELGKWVIATAFRFQKQWQEKGISNVRVAINLSARQLESDNLLPDLEDLLKQYEVDPAMIELEVTESAAMHHPENSIEKLRLMRRLGFELAIDDFGTGYSSLSYLTMLPIHTLKLDRAFVNNLESDPNNAAICKATISLSHDLGFKVVAEGVETEAQQQFLRHHGADILQGYFFSRPAKADEIEKYIHTFNVE